MSNFAFFDVDQTIYNGYSTPDFYLYLVTQGMGGAWTIAKDQEIGKLYKAGKITYKHAGEQVVQLLADTIAGHSVEKIKGLASQWVSTSLKVKPFVKEVVTILKANNFRTILVSGSSIPNVEAIFEVSGADIFHSTGLEVVDNKYTGKVIHMLDDEAKKSLILSNYKLDSSNCLKFGFGDSTGDVPMLSLCDHAFVISPHQDEMRLLSLAKGWHLVTNDNIIEIVRKTLNIHSVDRVDRNNI